MKLSFRKSFKIAPGIRLNIGKKGIGMSAGVKGVRVGINSRGTYVGGSIPGTGLSKTTYLSTNKRVLETTQNVELEKSTKDKEATKKTSVISGLILLNIFILILNVWVGIVAIALTCVLYKKRNRGTKEKTSLPDPFENKLS